VLLSYRDLRAGHRRRIRIDDFDFEIGGNGRETRENATRKNHTQESETTKHAHAILLVTRKGLLWWRLAPVSWLCE
jgi:hypothetical protein